MEKIANKAMTTAFNAIDNLIDELEVNELNYCRLRNYIKTYDSYQAYNRLITDFEDFMNERNDLL